MARQATQFQQTNEPITDVLRPVFNMPGPFNYKTKTYVYRQTIGTANPPGYTIDFQPLPGQRLALIYFKFYLVSSTTSGDFDLYIHDNVNNINAQLEHINSSAAGATFSFSSGTTGPLTSTYDNFLRFVSLSGGGGVQTYTVVAVLATQIEGGS